MASDALWIVSFKCVVKGYQECRFDVKDGEVFKVLKKIGDDDDGLDGLALGLRWACFV